MTWCRTGRITQAQHTHVIAPELQRAKGFQLSLFDPPNPKREALASVKAAVNSRFGRFKLRSATTLFLPKVYKDLANDFDICDVRGKVCFEDCVMSESA